MPGLLAVSAARAVVRCGLSLLLLAGLATPAFLPHPLSDNSLDHQPSVSLIKQAMTQDCQGGGYTTHCLKLTLLKVLSKAGSGELPLLPGLSLIWHRPQLQVEERNWLEEGERLDSLLLGQLGDTLSNLSLSVRLMDRETPQVFARALLGQEQPAATGRKKDKGSGALMAAGLMSGGTMVAVMLSALAAMSGKALMAALLALMLSGIAALKSGGEGETKTTYEIVAKPVVSHQHTHSSEVIHGGHHYKRSISAQNLAYMKQMPK